MNTLLFFVVTLVVIFAVLYFYRNNFVTVMSSLITFLMAISGVAVLLGVFVPSAFTAWAEYSLESAGTLQSIKKIDGTLSLSVVTDSANSTWNTIIGWFGATPVPTQAAGQPAQPAGIVEKNVYPGLVSSLAGAYRTGIIVVGLVFMGISVYLGYATSGAAEAAALSKKVAELESRLSKIEKK